MELFGDDRSYDVAVNDWTGSGQGAEEAEWRFAERGLKWPVIAKILPQVSRSYDFYAFFDDDLLISTEELNRLFELGSRLGLSLFQASLDPRSVHISHPFLRQRRDGEIARPVPFVENQMPVFSRSALSRCYSTFSLSFSGWGLDVLWAAMLRRRGVAVIDACAAVHTQPLRSGSWKLPSGKTPLEELIEILCRYDLMADYGPYFGFPETPNQVRDASFPDRRR